MENIIIKMDEKDKDWLKLELFISIEKKKAPVGIFDIFHQAKVWNAIISF